MPSRAPLVIRSLVPRSTIYLVVLLMFVLCVTMLVFLGSEMPPLVLIATGITLVGCPYVAINTFLGYPRLTLAGDHLAIWPSFLWWPKNYDLGPFGPAYAVLQKTKDAHTMALLFRLAENEDRYRATVDDPQAPAVGEADFALRINDFTGGNIRKGEAIAAEFNAYRGFG
jgi:hypothetical protein